MPYQNLAAEGMDFIIPARDSSHVIRRRLGQGFGAREALKRICERRGVIVQAGGNWGYWPWWMSFLFSTVYTFEPDSECFTCLVANTAERHNVVRIQAALGDERKLIELWRDTDTTGNQHVDGPGIYPTLRIDDLALPECDLIYLDIEGEEPAALRGAEQTIRRCKPMVIFESKGKFDYASDGQKFMCWLGYKKIDNIHSDIVMVSL